MSEKKKDGLAFVSFTDRETEQRVMCNAGNIILCYEVERISKDKSLSIENPVAVKMFGEAPIIVKETYDEVEQIVKDAGVNVFKKAAK